MSWNLLQDVDFMMSFWTRFLYQPRGYLSFSGISNQLLLQTQTWPLLSLHGGNWSHPVRLYFLPFLPLFFFSFFFLLASVSAAVLVSRKVYWPKAVLSFLAWSFNSQRFLWHVLVSLSSIWLIWYSVPLITFLPPSFWYMYIRLFIQAQKGQLRRLCFWGFQHLRSNTCTATSVPVLTTFSNVNLFVFHFLLIIYFLWPILHWGVPMFVSSPLEMSSQTICSCAPVGFPHSSL